MHYIEIHINRFLDLPTFRDCNNTLKLIEGPTVPNDKKIRDALDILLLRKYEAGLDHFVNYLSMYTDGAGMARIANPSVSQELDASDEACMGCLAHFLKNVMKNVLTWCRFHSPASTVRDEFRAMKNCVKMPTAQNRNIFYQTVTFWNRNVSQDLELSIRLLGHS